MSRHHKEPRLCVDSEPGLFAAVLVVKLSSAIKDRVTVGDGAGSSLVVELLLV